MGYRKVKPQFPKIHQKIPYRTLPSIHKSSGIFLKNGVEATPIIFEDNLLLFTFKREGSHGTAVEVYDFFTRKRLAKLPWKYGLACAIVVDGTIHLFGSSDWGASNSIHHVTLDGYDTIVGDEQVLEASPKEKFYNTSVCASPDGFVLAYELREPHAQPFSVRYLKSPDLSNWEKVGGILHPEQYCACPTIRYLDGWYYVIYLAHKKSYLEQIARTRDFLTYEDHMVDPQKNPEYCVLSPKGYTLEGINNSDIDLVEYRGQVYIVYADGNQNGWGDLRTALYPGTLKQMVGEFYHE